VRLGPLAIAAVAGASMAVQGTLNAILGKHVGGFEASFIVHMIGAALLGLALLTGITGGSLKGAAQAPWHSFLGGPLSVLIIWGVLTSVGEAGVSAANTAIVSSQILAALALDALGLSSREFNFTWMKAIGAILLIAGTYMLLKE